MIDRVIKVSIAHSKKPIVGKRFELDTESDEALAYAESLGFEAIVEDIVSDFDLMGGKDLGYYIDMQELFSSRLDESDLIKGRILLSHDSRYYSDSGLLKHEIEESCLYSGSLKDVAVEIFIDHLASILGEEHVGYVSGFLSEERCVEEFENANTYVEASFGIGKNYILVINN